MSQVSAPTSSTSQTTASTPSSDDEWPSISDLPGNTEWKIGSTANGIMTVVKQEQAKETRAAPYIVFSNVPPEIVEQSNKRPNLVGGRNVRIFYDERTRYLVVKLVSGPHEVAERMLSRKLEQAAENMGLEDDLIPTGSKRIELTPHSKEPDSSWRPHTFPAGRTGKWPMVVVESGFSESLSRLRLDAQWWITRSGGDVKVVILIAILPSGPRIVIEKWTPDPNVETLRPGLRDRSPRVTGTRVQETILTRGAKNFITITGAPLVVTFDEMFLRTASPPQEFDIVVSMQALESIARKIWEEQGI